jgi:hypothetical protein
LRRIPVIEVLVMCGWLVARRESSLGEPLSAS